jgi:hypothetical protein
MACVLERITFDRAKPIAGYEVSLCLQTLNAVHANQFSLGRLCREGDRPPDEVCSPTGLQIYLRSKRDDYSSVRMLLLWLTSSG